MTLEDRFEAADDEFLKFERIPQADRRHPRRDVCAFIYLHEKLGGEHAIIGDASHDEIHISYSEKDRDRLTQDDIVYIHRCGIRLDEYGLCMFV